MAFKRATGALRAVATLSGEQRAAMLASDKGEVTVPVTVTDEAGVGSPVECGICLGLDFLRPAEVTASHAEKLLSLRSACGYGFPLPLAGEAK